MKHNLHNTNVIVTSLSSITEFYVIKESNLQILEKLQNDLNTEDTLTESRAMKTKNFVPAVVDVIMAKYPFDSISVKDQTKTLFEELVVGRSLSLQVMKENFQKKLLEVDLIRVEEDNVKNTSVRACLVYIGGALFETNSFAIVPNEKHHQFKIRKLLKPESEHDVFLSHISDTSPGKNVHVYVQVFPIEIVYS